MVPPTRAGQRAPAVLFEPTMMRTLHVKLFCLCVLPLLAACPPEDPAAAGGEVDIPGTEADVADTEPELVATATAETVPAGEPDLAAPADVAAPPADAQRSVSGLASSVLQPGSGSVHPTPNDTVEVHYTGWTKDGKMFDSSVKRGETVKFPLNRVIPGWTEGLQLMVAGEKRRLWIPAELAYGEVPARPGAPAGDLVFDVELITVLSAPDVPSDVASVPADAQRTESGLAYRVLTPGTSGPHPAATQTVTVHYSGWMLDGKMFDSSVARGEPASFPLNAVIAGWTEGVQLMVVGEKTRFWIPADLAYGETPQRPGAPSGMLVFDIELLGIE